MEDFNTWMNVRKHYLPTEYHRLFDIISGHSDNYHKLPTIEELKLEIRDSATLDKVYALETIEVEIEPFLLLDYLKTEFTQGDALINLDRWIDNSIAFESAEEIVASLEKITSDLKTRVDLIPPEENMQKINLFESVDEMANRITLGLNEDFDATFDFLATDLIMIGGRRGSGKSITASNIANHIVYGKTSKGIFVPGKRVGFFSIEMQPREVLQRACSIRTGVSYRRIRNQELSVTEWEKVAQWWASRYEDSDSDLKMYHDHRDFKRFHAGLSKKPLVKAFIDIVYDAGLTLGKIKSEADRMMRETDGEIGLFVVDYINKVKRIAQFSSTDHLDWKEQLAMAHAFKQMAQELKVPFFTPYQTDATGEARMAKGLLDSTDASFTLDPHTKKDRAITFNTTKMRSGDDEHEFTSEMDWDSLAIGPKSVEKPLVEVKEKKIKNSSKTGESVYDDSPF